MSEILGTGTDVIFCRNFKVKKTATLREFMETLAENLVSSLYYDCTHIHSILFLSCLGFAESETQILLFLQHLQLQEFSGTALYFL